MQERQFLIAAHEWRLVGTSNLHSSCCLAMIILTCGSSYTFLVGCRTRRASAFLPSQAHGIIEGARLWQGRDMILLLQNSRQPLVDTQGLTAPIQLSQQLDKPLYRR